MKVVFKIIKIVTMIYLSLVIVCTATIFIQSKFNLEDYPNIFGFSLLNVKSASMTPSIMINDKVLTKKINSKNIKNNDIIVYIDDGNTLISRIVKAEGSGLIAKGDANNSNETIFEGLIVAKVIMYGKTFNTIATILLNPLFIIIFIILGISIPDKIIDNINSDE